MENGEGIKESDLKGALKNATPEHFEDEKDAKDNNAYAQLSDKAKEDYQLLRAIDLLRGVSLYNSQHPVTVGEKENNDGDE